MATSMVSSYDEKKGNLFSSVIEFEKEAKKLKDSKGERE